MKPDELISVYPRLYHMAHREAWEGIQRNGLLSTAALLDLFEITGEEREDIERTRRPESRRITHPKHGTAVIRDNKPLSEAKLLGCLEDMTPPDFYQLLNERVFFWVSLERLERLLQARAYRSDPHLVLTVDTERLVRRHEREISLSPINSGATVHTAPRRGSFTFQRIDEFDFEHWRRLRSRRLAVVELAVDYAVPDLLDVLLEAELRQPNGDRVVIWSRSNTI